MQPSLNVTNLRSPSPMNKVFLEACQATGIPFNPDINGAEHHGCYNAQVTQKGGERHSTAAAFIHPNLDRPNLKVISGAHTARLLLEQRRAVGAEFYHAGVTRRVRARREVVLSSGAFGSPQLLMASGIGQADHLQALGIQTVLNLPGVGQNLQDHISALLIYRSPGNHDTFGVSPVGVTRMIKAMLEWRKRRTGLLTSCAAESGAYYRTSPEVEASDMEIEFIVSIIDDHARKTHLGHGYSAHLLLARPQSKGEVRLASPDTRVMPLIDPRYFSHPYDMPTLIKGVQIGLDIMNAKPFDPYRGDMLIHYDRNDPAQIEATLRERADTEYHVCGTCRMGPDSDPTAVVDAQLRVKRIAGLRVVDASIMPCVTSNNTNAPTIMIGEKGAAMIRAAM